MKFIIKPMDEIIFDDSKVFGNKIAYLAEAKRNGISVLDGFCISFQNNKEETDSTLLKEAIQKLIAPHPKQEQKYIVRSSSQYEDGKTNVFPGVFKSKKEISTVEEMQEAIRECYQSFFSEKAKRYVNAMNLKNLEQDYFGVLIQKQLEPQYSGVLFTTNPMDMEETKHEYYVELVNGHCQDMLQGKKHAHSYVIKKVGNQYKIEESHNAVPEDGIEAILHQLGIEIEKVIQVFGKHLDIEWAYVNQKIVIWQIRPISVKKRNQKEHIACGEKAKAMKKFKEIGLFPKTLLIIEAGKSLHEIECSIREADFAMPKLTVRFSCKNELGLPRFFAEDKEEAIAFIRANYCEKWTAIIHESIEVKNSYELYRDKEKCVIEHMPGIWESDAKISTDTWIFGESSVKAYICSGERLAKYENASGIEYKKFPPITEEKAHWFAKSMLPYIHKIQQNWSDDERVNFHFVSDDEKLYFLNKRNTKQITLDFVADGNMAEIKSKADILKWDKKSPVLLKLDLKRGQEGTLEEYATRFREHGTKVYIEFGMLSHPAIFLRELGIDVYPLYLKHRKLEFLIQKLK
uniref:PEP/pyruvate-binding domain-containing protein n=1 Tax=Agathobacter sp. TaxID=2021311 RepID=UPI00405773C6